MPSGLTAFLSLVKSLLPADDNETFNFDVDLNANWEILDDAIKDLSDEIDAIQTVPTGTVIDFAGSTPPTGYLKANGVSVSRTTYANLFAVIGTIYGVGNGSTTFNLPDLRGEFVRGWDDGRGVDTGRVLGSAQTDELKAHTHGGVPRLENDASAGSDASCVSFTAKDNTTSTGGTETRPRNIALLKCIKY